MSCCCYDAASADPGSVGRFLLVGKLYGMAGGGINGYGVIFSFDPVSLIFTRLLDFDDSNGSYPQAGSSSSEISKQAMPRQYSLSNYPNPFTGTSTIRYQLPEDSKVSIKVYDALGRAVTSLVDGYKKAGNHSVTFNAGHYNGAAFYYRIIARSATGHFEQTNKMILVR